MLSTLLTFLINAIVQTTGGLYLISNWVLIWLTTHIIFMNSKKISCTFSVLMLGFLFWASGSPSFVLLSTSEFLSLIHLYIPQNYPDPVEPFFGTGADPGFNSYNAPTNPNYWPFRQHLRSRCSLTRSSNRGLQDTCVYNQRKCKVDPGQQHTTI
jgi:hypothetical protein